MKDFGEKRGYSHQQTKKMSIQISLFSKLTKYNLYSDYIICIKKQYLLQRVKGEIILKCIIFK